MSEKKDKIRQTNLSRVHPRLRKICNGGNEVNKTRSRQNATVSFKLPEEDRVEESKVTSQNGTLIKGKYGDDPPYDAFVNLFITLKEGSTWKEAVHCLGIKKKEKERLVNSYRSAQRLIKIRVSADHISILSECVHIKFIECSQAILTPRLSKYPLSFEKKPGQRFDAEDFKKSKGKVLIGIIDVGGFDFTHEDFITKNGTKFHSIWDQGDTTYGRTPAITFKSKEHSIEKTFRELTYGKVITKDQINIALQDAKKYKFPAQKIEFQSQEMPSSHATHVASIAAGNSGVCPNAEIIGVLVSIPEKEDTNRRATFTDSSRLSDAVDYCLAIAAEMNLPISLNISLGTNGHSHDGSSPVNRWIDAQLVKPSRCLCVASGNAGQEKATNDQDWGYMMGRIHTSGHITNAGLRHDLEWNVHGDGIKDVSENELEIWYQPQDRFSIMIKPPEGDWIGPIGPQENVENLQLDDGTFLSVYNQLFYHANGSNYISIYLSPYFGKNDFCKGIKAGKWKVRIIGDEIRDGRFDAWIERDNFYHVEDQAWSFPSFFSETTNVDEKSINSLACGQNVIAVGNYNQVNDKINISSSQGPTRDGRNKPEIIAPGTNIVAANGFTGAPDAWTSMTGTSMSSPYVCGAAALLLQRHEDLTSSQISAIFKRTSTPMAGMGYNWKNDIGFGIINIVKAIEEAELFVSYKEVSSKFKNKRS